MEITSADFAQLNSAIGSLTAQVEALRRDFERYEDTSHDYRTKVHVRLDDAIERLANVEASVKLLQTYSEDTVRPTVEFVKTMRNRGIGFITAVGLAATALGVTIGDALYYYWGKLVKLLNSL